jgi:Flp pilus assembly protein protease CpaA
MLALIILTLIWLVVASISDLKRREVPNWLSFSLIIFALAFRAFYSVFYSDAGFFVHGVMGFLLFLGLAYVFYYARVFAGGDAKLLMGLGAVLPFASSLYTNLFIVASFIFLLLLVGGFYGMLYSFVLVILNRNNFVKEFKKQFKMRKMLVILGLVLALLSLIFVFYIGDSLLFLLPNQPPFRTCPAVAGGDGG